MFFFCSFFLSGYALCIFSNPFLSNQEHLQQFIYFQNRHYTDINFVWKICLTERLVRIVYRWFLYVQCALNIVCDMAVQFAKKKWYKRIAILSGGYQCSFCVHFFLSEITLTFANDFKLFVFLLFFYLFLFLSLSVSFSFSLSQNTFFLLQHFICRHHKKFPLKLNARMRTVNGTKDWFFSSTSSYFSM